MDRLLFTQYGHSTCARLTLPHALHLFNAVTSFSALPAICRCRFFMWLVFFLGTAFSIPSHICSSNDGMGTSTAGRRLAAARSCCICWRRGIRRTAASCGRRRARTTGRKAERRDADGARNVAIVLMSSALCLVCGAVTTVCISFITGGQICSALDSANNAA